MNLKKLVIAIIILFLFGCITGKEVQKKETPQGLEYGNSVTKVTVHRKHIEKRIHYIVPPEIKESKDYTKFKEYLDLIRKDPTLADVHYDIGVLYTKYKKYDYAAKAYENALKIRPDYVEAAVNLADAYRHLGNTVAAEAILKRLLRENPGEIRLLNALAIVYREEGKLDESLRLSLEVLQKKQKYLPARLNVGLIYLMKKKYAMAYYVFDTSKDLDPNNPAIHEYKGYTLYFLGDYDGAEKEFKKALKLNPGKAEIYVDLALIKMKKEKWKKAEKLIIRALKLKPLMAEAHLDLGVIYLKMGKLKKAYYELKKALEYGADKATVYYNLAIVASLYRRKPELAAKKAIEYFQGYLKYAKNISPDKRKEIENLINDIKDVGVEVVYIYKPLFSQLPAYARPKEEGMPQMAGYGNETSATSNSPRQATTSTTNTTTRSAPSSVTNSTKHSTYVSTVTSPSKVTSSSSKKGSVSTIPSKGYKRKITSATVQNTVGKKGARAVTSTTIRKNFAKPTTYPANLTSSTIIKKNVSPSSSKFPQPVTSKGEKSRKQSGGQTKQPVEIKPEEIQPIEESPAEVTTTPEEVQPAEPEEIQPAEPQQPEEIKPQE